MLENRTFSGRTLLITGGTGSFGNSVLVKALSTSVSEIRIFSRDEKKQEELRQYYRDDRIKFVIGDVRDLQAVRRAMNGVDFVFHAAALKQVPSCEFHPIEALKTNVMGTENVLDAAIEAAVKRVICLSTDKAVYPINAMGMSKALMEKVAVARARNSRDTIINITRYGNVLASRGSVVPLFISQIGSDKPISITQPDMTRFVMTLDEAVELVMFAFKHGEAGEIFVQKAPSITIDKLATATMNVLGKPDHPIHIMGPRHGEKKHEVLVSSEEMLTATDMGDYFRISPDPRDLNYEKFLESGNPQIADELEFTSGTTQHLTVEQMGAVLLELQEVREALINKSDVSS